MMVMGFMINSSFLNNLTIDDAKKKIIEEIENLKIGNKKISFRLKDWGYPDKDIGAAQFQ